VHGTGVDVADVARFARLVARGPVFTGRWFSADEIAHCQWSPDPARAYAGCFAGKEAVWKALALTDWTGPVPWRWIAVVERLDGAWDVTLSGPVAAAAASACVGDVQIAITHSGARAVAIALATAREGACCHGAERD
jgi:phosphopantetheine--protein transferase-like protein